MLRNKILPFFLGILLINLLAACNSTATIQSAGNITEAVSTESAEAQTSGISAQDPQPKIEKITFEDSEFALKHYSYVIDLKAKHFSGIKYDYDAPDAYENPKPADQVEKDLTTQAIEIFEKALLDNGFYKWDGEYSGNKLNDYGWSIDITFFDSSNKKVWGFYDGYPDTWIEVGDAFYELTGKDVLDTLHIYW